MEQARISSSQGTQAPPSARPRHSADGAGAAQAPHGFLALLSAMDDAASQSAGSSLADLVGDGAGLADLGSDASGANGANGANGVNADPSLLAAWQGLLGPSANITGSAVGGAELGAGVSATLSAWKGALVGGDGVKQGLVAETAVLDGAADAMGLGMQTQAAGYGRILSRMHSAMGQARATQAEVGGLSDGPAGARHGMNSGSYQHLATSGPTQASALKGASEGGAGATQSVSPGSGSERVALAVPTSLGTETLSAVSESAGTVAGLSRSSEPRGEGNPSSSGQHSAGGMAEGAHGASPMESAAADGAAMLADPSQAGAEELVADQVAYWVNQKTQNAELTLTRDGQPVEVSVSLSGNEAHVSFRSDQSETRELLDRSMAQLSDLLRSEGLVLSGMTVGTSAQGSAGFGDSGQQPGQREGARHAQVISSVSAEESVRPRSSGVNERSVDIFV